MSIAAAMRAETRAARYAENGQPGRAAEAYREACEMAFIAGWLESARKMRMNERRMRAKARRLRELATRVE